MSDCILWVYYVPVFTVILLHSSNRGWWCTIKPSIKVMWAVSYIELCVLTNRWCCLMWAVSYIVLCVLTNRRCCLMWAVSYIVLCVLTNRRCCLTLLLLHPETYFTQIGIKWGLFIILVYATCLGGESGSTEVQEQVATSYKRKLLFTGRH